MRTFQFKDFDYCERTGCCIKTVDVYQGTRWAARHVTLAVENVTPPPALVTWYASKARKVLQ